MLQYAAEIDEDVDVQTFFLPEYDMNYKSTCWLVVQKLLQLHQSHEAEMFATAARLPLEDLFLLQVMIKMFSTSQGVEIEAILQPKKFC